jgi:hypothetical protein
MRRAVQIEARAIRMSSRRGRTASINSSESAPQTCPAGGWASHLKFCFMNSLFLKKTLILKK